MKRSSILWLLILLLVMAGCAPAGENTALSVPDAEEQVAESALVTVAPTEAVAPTESADREEPAGPTPIATVTPPKAGQEANSDVTTEEMPVGDEPEDDGTIREVVPPGGTVNLSEITPAPPTEGGAVEAPRPGVSDPETFIAWNMSQDLAERLGIDVTEVTLISIEEVDWPDSSLGCPQAGFGYLQVIIPGLLITLEAEGDWYTYHTDWGDNFVLCIDGSPAVDKN